MKIWYEVFINKGNETQTVDTCSTLSEARTSARRLLKEGAVYLDTFYKVSRKNLFIDKWSKDTPIVSSYKY